MERLGEVENAAPEVGAESASLVEPALPVEGRLECVLHRESATVDEEQVRQGRVAEHPGEGVDEPGHRHGVDVGVARLVRGGRGEFGGERRVVDDVGVVHPERGGREEPEHVEVGRAVPLVDEPHPP